MGRAEDIFERLKKDGESVIDQFIVNRASEELFLDFKRSTNNGNGEKLDDKDRRNLAKAISGFGNSEGGVIIWGVDCSKDALKADVAKAKVPIGDVAKFVSWLENAISGCTIPPHKNVQNHLIIKSNSEGYVVTYIPKSNLAPHQQLPDGKYFMRAGSSFVPVPHGILEGMFGKRPQPKLDIEFKVLNSEIHRDDVRVSIRLLLENLGSGISNDSFVNLYADNVHNIQINFSCLDTNWKYFSSIRTYFTAITRPDVKIPPQAKIESIFINIIIKDIPVENLVIAGTFGCENWLTKEFKLNISMSHIKDEWEKAKKKHGSYLSKVPLPGEFINIEKY